MSLREARFEDHWRHVFSRTYPTRFTSVTVQHLASLADTTITFSAGLTAIVGGNGAGKSTLVSAIAQLLASDPNSVERGYLPRLTGSSISGVAFNEGAERHLSVQDGDNGKRRSLGDAFDGEYRWLDPSSLANRCLLQIHTDQNFNDLLEGVTPLGLVPEEREIASYLVGKQYSEIKIFEILEYAGLEIFPYFEVSAGGVTYRTEGMGRGELSLLLAYWTLKGMPGNSILILEEPETHVSPRSQDSLMNVVAKFSDEMGIWVIVTTHSPTVIRRMPKEHLRLLVRDRGPANLTAATKLDIALLLGGGVAYRGVILVEDECAKRFLLAIMEKLDPEMLRQFEVVSAGSDGAITAALSGMPTTRSWFTFVGAYDGDLREKIDHSNFKWPFAHLPGNAAPDVLLKAEIEKLPNIGEVLSLQLSRTLDEVRIALERAAGIDHHDYLGQLAGSLNIDRSIVTRAVTIAWLGTDDNLISARRFIDDLRRAVKAC